MTIISIEFDIYNRRMVSFQKEHNAVEHSTHLPEHFGCNDEDSDEVLLSAAADWQKEIWEEDDIEIRWNAPA